MRKSDLETQITRGDEVETVLKPTTFRLYFQNVKGLHLQRTKMDLKYFLETMKKMGVGLFGWAETNTNWVDLSTLIEYREKVSKALKVAKSTFSTSAIP